MVALVSGGDGRPLDKRPIVSVGTGVGTNSHVDGHLGIINEPTVRRSIRTIANFEQVCHRVHCTLNGNGSGW